MSPITVIFWQFVCLLVMAAFLIGLLVLVFDQRDDLRHTREQRDHLRREDQQARAALVELKAAREQDLVHLTAENNRLLDEIHAQQLLIETFIPDAYTGGPS